ncbi:type II secretion system protein GspG [Corallococcus praedator]|uniref:Type II secretion system core protein G n=1 Tax=Corallococcus praedator TaxID=2316724 RepID=A0ABX9QFI1_9BACT|nr:MULTISPECIES: type II secretion system major pseudopilin GspG [Corallococcus]RKH16644.1 type II secretion system protein GspG [Corallococcus sp. CA047B]RKH30933.1 type II secretion system protein GspG [Corallococcus sp. CA031C]RKI06538.1 type II secretion system protein GspG [Corallococcus praedator]
MTTTNAKKQQRRRNRGMTLIEIMVVITILGLIAAAVGVAVIPKLEEAKQDTARLDIRNIQSAMKLYYTKKGSYPDTATGLKALVDTQNLERMPTDPWGKEYVYMNEGGKPVITSYGADGNPGGEGSDADISSKDTGPKP